VARWNRPDRHAGDDRRLAGPELDDLALGQQAPASGAEAARHDDRRAARQRAQRALVEVVGMAVRDEDDVGLEPGGLGMGSVPLERPEARPQERVREDPGPGYLDERRRMADELDGDSG
jgi:hypothetical protein